MPFRSKLLSSGLLVGATAGLAGLAIFAAPAQGTELRVNTARPTLAIRGKAPSPVSGLAPGDSVQRLVELRYGKKGRLARVSLVTRARSSSLLDSDRKRGLRLTIDRCSKPWRRAKGASTFTCRGRRKVVLSSVPVIGKRRLRKLSLTPRQTDHLRLTLTLSGSAGNEFQSKVSKIVYRFVGVAATRRQAAATAKRGKILRR